MNDVESFVNATREAIRAIYLAASPSVDLDMIPEGESVHYNHCVLTTSEASKIWNSIFKKWGVPKITYNQTKLWWLINSGPSDVLGRECGETCYVCSMGFKSLVDVDIDVGGAS